jgi:hypothetical protein
MVFDMVLMQHTVEQTNTCAWQYIRKCVAPFIFCSRLKEWQDVIVDQMYVVLALFMLTGILQNQYKCHTSAQDSNLDTCKECRRPKVLKVQQTT